ncbi:MAG: xanthine dehydrogenase family protein molybdopterin-binding subunit [Pseudomonadota bacterium]
MNAIVPPKFGVGASVRRKEDATLITGTGCFTDDERRENACHAYVVRSPYAHANFKITDLSAANEAPGVQLILTAEDLTDYSDLPCRTLLPQVDGTPLTPRNVPLLCRETVRHVGDAVAFVVADSLEDAQEAAELIEIDYESLDATIDTVGCLDDGAPLVHPEHGSNLAFEVAKGDKEKVAEIFASADHVVELPLINNRLVCNYMEPRVCVAEWSDEEERLTLVTGSQGVHGLQGIICAVMNLDPEQLRVVTRDVGGGFGTKNFPYREHPLSLEAARRLKRPVRWVCERSEHFVADAHGRDNVVTMKMALDKDGRFLAMDVDLYAAMGAYLNTFGPFIPTLGYSIATGIYDIEHAYFHIRGTYTNTTMTDAYRGAGRPEAIYALERLVDRCAMELGLEPAEIRRRNAIKPEQMPYQTVLGGMFDTGEFTSHLEQCLKAADWDGFEARNNAAKSNERIRGIGLSTYIEACAFAGSEPAKIEMNPNGRVTVLIGTQANGQGHQTAYAQFAADALGLSIDDIDVHQGDTDRLKSGGGTGGSRSIPLGGVSVRQASEDMAEKIKAAAADELEAAPGDLELIEGSVRIVGTDRSITFADLAKAVDDLTALTGNGEFKQAEATYPNGTHVCEVEIDPATGVTEIVNYTAVDDFGNTVNPILLAGQVHGGIVQAAGQCLMEETIYDEDGQLLTASFMDYRMPRAADFPDIDFTTRNVPSTTNAMGIKGAGEAGTIGAGPAVMNAVVDALRREYGIKHIDMPATPKAVWNAIQGA